MLGKTLLAHFVAKILETAIGLLGRGQEHFIIEHRASDDLLS
jgi:hypothetical protein